MKKRDLLSLHNALTMVEARQFSVKFSYFIAKNKVSLKNEYDALNEARKANPEFVTYDTKRAEMAHEMADRDEDGKAKIENNNFIIIEKVDEFKEELDKLKKKFAKVITDQDQKIKDFNDLLNEEVEYAGTKIDFKDIPTGIEAAVLETFIIADLIIEE